jgi:hypothetical protein
VLPRDEFSTPRKGTAGFDYPSQESVQAAGHTLAVHGLLLESDGAELGEETATLSWSLTHVESGERKVYVLEWPLFSDMTERAHQFAAAWSHAERHLVCHLLGLRVEPRSVAGVPVADDVPAWGGGRGKPTPAAPARDVPFFQRPAVVPQSPPGFSDQALIDHLMWWIDREQLHDRTEGAPPRELTIASAWAACAGVPVAPAANLTLAQRERLFAWLTSERARP